MRRKSNLHLTDGRLAVFPPINRRIHQIIARGDGRWLIRVYLGRDHDTSVNTTIEQSTVPCGKRTPPDVYSNDEVTKVLRKADPVEQAILLTCCCYTGMREQVICYLAWKDLDQT